VSYCLNDDRIANVPTFSFSANTEIRFPVGTLAPFVRGLFSYQPSFFASTVNFDYPSRSLVNLYVGLRGPDARWEVSLFAKNALDQNRITNISAGNSQQPTFGAPYDSGYRTINATNPREFGLTATYNFD
jgi:iron complex outermembrane receptor protein